MRRVKDVQGNYVRTDSLRKASPGSCQGTSGERQRITSPWSTMDGFALTNDQTDHTVHEWSTHPIRPSPQGKPRAS